MWQEESILIENNCGSSRKNSASAIADAKKAARKKSKQFERNFYRDSMEEDVPEDECKCLHWKNNHFQ